MSILSQSDTLKKVRSWKLDTVFWYSLVLAGLLIYFIDEIVKIDNLDTKGWHGIVIVMIAAMFAYVISFANLDKMMKSLSVNKPKLILLGSALFITPLAAFFLLDRQNKYSITGIPMILLSVLGLFITLSSTETINKKLRLVISIIASAVMFLGYLSSWYVHYKEEHKLVFIIWLISATLLILTREGLIKKGKSVINKKIMSERTLFFIIAGFSILSSITLYSYPVKSSFSTYTETVELVTLITGILIFILRMNNMKGLAELIWIWLLSFINILVIDGFVKFSQTSKIISEDYDIIANSVVNFPIFINALMAFYTTYRGVRRSTYKDKDEEIGFWVMIALSAITYASSFMSLLLNAGSLEEELLSERLFLLD